MIACVSTKMYLFADDAQLYRVAMNDEDALWK